MEQTEASPKDAELRRFVARQHVYDGEYHARKAASAPPGKAEREADAREAMAAFDTALRLAPDSVRAWKQKAALHQVLGQNSQAAKCFERALSLRADPETLQARVLVAFSEGHDADALAGLGRIPSEGRSRLSYQIEGYLRALAGEAGLAASTRSAIPSPPRRCSMSAKGNALNNLRRFDEAMACHDRAIAAEPGYWHPYYCKACTMALTGQNRQKIYALIRTALGLAPPERQRTFRDEPGFASLRGDPAFVALFDPGAPAPPRAHVGGRTKKPTGGKPKRNRKR